MASRVVVVLGLHHQVVRGILRLKIHMDITTIHHHQCHHKLLHKLRSMGIDTTAELLRTPSTAVSAASVAFKTSAVEHHFDPTTPPPADLRPDYANSTPSPRTHDVSTQTEPTGTINTLPTHRDWSTPNPYSILAPMVQTTGNSRIHHTPEPKLPNYNHLSKTDLQNILTYIGGYNTHGSKPALYTRLTRAMKDNRMDYSDLPCDLTKTRHLPRHHWDQPPPYAPELRPPPYTVPEPTAPPMDYDTIPSSSRNTRSPIFSSHSTGLPTIVATATISVILTLLLIKFYISYHIGLEITFP